MTKPYWAKFNSPLFLGNIPGYYNIPSDMTPSNELHIRVEHNRKLYTDDTGRFHVCSRSGKKYIIIVYHFDSNAIIATPFKYSAKKHRLLAYNSIMQRIKDRNMLVDLNILDNEASAEYNRIIKSEWGVEYQLVPPHIHFYQCSWMCNTNLQITLSLHLGWNIA